MSSELSAAIRAYNASVGMEEIAERDHEYPIELNYNYAITPAIQVMPSIQYVISPSGDDDAENAVILGLQLNLNF